MEENIMIVGNNHAISYRGLGREGWQSFIKHKIMQTDWQKYCPFQRKAARMTHESDVMILFY
jgi:hypothetical protein